MKKIFEIIMCILGIFAFYLVIKGWQVTFTTDKVYIKYGEDIFHSTPLCPRIGVDETDIEYMQESGKVTGSKEFSRSESISDLALDMCPYCFSSYEINRRNDYYKEVFKERYPNVVRNAKKLRREKEEKRLKEKYPQMFE